MYKVNGIQNPFSDLLNYKKFDDNRECGCDAVNTKLHGIFGDLHDG